MIEQERPRYRWVMLACLMSIGLVGGFALSVMPVLFDEIEEELSLTHAQVGLIWGAVALGGLLTALLGGMAGDRFGAKRVIAAGLVVEVITLVLRASFPSFVGLGLSMLLFGMALGFIMPNTGKTVGMWFSSRELGRILGLLTVEGAATWAIGLAIGPTLSSALGGWQNVMWLAVAFSIVAVIVWTVFARERPVTAVAPAKDGLSAWERLKTVFHIRDLWLIALLGTCVSGAAVTNVGLLPETLEDRGMSSAMAVASVTISTAVVSVFSIIGPTWSDKVGLRKPFILPFLLICCATVTFFGIFTGAPLIIMIVVYSAALGTAMPLFRVLILENERIGPNLAGSAFGLLHSVNRTGAMALPFTMGAIIDATGEHWHGFLLLAALYAIGVVLITQIKETGWKAKETVATSHYR